MNGEVLRILIEIERPRLFASYAEGRSPRWTCDQRTKDTVCLSVWLREELERLDIDELGRKVQEGEFYRYARSDEDLFELAATILNNAVTGNIDRDRRTHRRWG
jgi:hypothetical protein